MNQLDGIPPPDGFFTGNGFPLRAGTVLAGRAPAELLPHHGFITAISGNPNAAVPPEEYVHAGTIFRNPDLTGAALIDYWHGKPQEPPLVIDAWSPFVEAIHTVYTELHRDAKPLNESDGDLRTANTEYGDWYVARLRAQQHHSPRTRQPPRGHDFERMAQERKQQEQKIVTKKLTRFISDYTEENLQDDDLHERWRALEGGDDFATLLLVELHLPVIAASTAMERTGTWIHLAPHVCWRAIEATLDVWIELVSRGISPFPIRNATPPVLFDAFEALWANLNTTTIALITQALLSKKYRPYLTRSFLALVNNVNPHAAVTWFHSVHHVHQYPVLVLLHDRPECTIVDPQPNKQDILSYAQTIWHAYKQCPLYSDLTAWLNTTQDLDSYTMNDFTSMALQLWQYLTRVESLWNSHGADPRSLDCTHCQALLTVIASNRYVANALELRLFTKLALSPLLAAARNYISWIEQEVTKTYLHHPALPAQGATTYRQQPFLGVS